MSTSNKPTVMVSVIIPCYNMGRFIGDALDSVFKQTYGNYEIIIVNDGSTEPFTLQLLNGLDHDNVTVINQENMGLPAARNRGVKAARGKYISCLDADDKFHVDFLKHTVKLLEGDIQEELGFVGVMARLFGRRKALWKPLPYDPLELLKLNLFQSANLYRKKAWHAVGGYNEQMKQGYEDWDFWIGIVEHGYKWDIIQKELIYYRIRKRSMVTFSNQLHPRLYESIIQNHPKIFKQYALQLIAAHMDSIFDKDQLIGYLNLVIKQERKKITTMKQQINQLEGAVQENQKLAEANNSLNEKLAEAHNMLGQIKGARAYALYAQARKLKQKLKNEPPKDES